ncbi:MAG: N-formylglutamate amidohydrolase [Pseudomonadota bacterium]
MATIFTLLLRRMATPFRPKPILPIAKATLGVPPKTGLFAGTGPGYMPRAMHHPPSEPLSETDPTPTTAYAPVEIAGANRGANIVIVCDHAANTVPRAVADGDLGLAPADMARHIAYDIGAAGVARALGDALDAPVCLSNFSRLVIDPNRGEDDPTLLMRLYDGTIIPGNRHADAGEIERRLDLCYRPYHQAVAGLVAARNRPVILSIHSFTPQLRGRPTRPWHLGILSAADRRLSDAVLTALAPAKDIMVGDNEPYSGALGGDCMDQHALRAGLHHTLIELRQDLIETANQQAAWAARLAPVLRQAISQVTTPPSTGA